MRNMSIEVELKAHVRSPENTKALMDKKLIYKGSFIKKDEYWYPESGSAIYRNFSKSGLRIRKETFTDNTGTVNETVYITWKVKEIRENIEVNKENEFIVDNFGEFKGFLALLGFRKGKEKQKTGFLYVKDRLKAELCEVKNLGFFLEIEIIPENDNEKTIKAARDELFCCLSTLEIGKEELETRFYSEILAENWLEAR